MSVSGTSPVRASEQSACVELLLGRGDGGSENALATTVAIARKRFMVVGYAVPVRGL